MGSIVPPRRSLLVSAQSPNVGDVVGSVFANRIRPTAMPRSTTTTTMTRAAIPFRSRTVRKETLHSVSLALPHVSHGASVLDVGCGEGYVIEELARRGLDAQGVDIVDIRLPRGCPFRLYDGQFLPF